jgi:hypothetical protein
VYDANPLTCVCHDSTLWHESASWNVLVVNGDGFVNAPS